MEDDHATKARACCNKEMYVIARFFRDFVPNFTACLYMVYKSVVGEKKLARTTLTQ